jgi:hypothetical protein
MGSPLLLLARRDVGNPGVDVVGELVLPRLVAAKSEVEQDVDDAVALGKGLDELLPRRRGIVPLLELLLDAAEVLPRRE